MTRQINMLLTKPIIPLTLAAVFCALTIYQIINFGTRFNHQMPKVMLPKAKPITTNYHNLDAPIFGNYITPKPIKATDSSIVNLDISGIMFAKNHSAVILKIANNDERSYTVGSEPAPGITINEILPDSIIISRNGKFESLELPREASLAIASPIKLTDHIEEEE